MTHAPDGAAGLHYRLGLLLGGIGWLEGAVQALREAAHLAPEHAETHFHLGEALGRGGRWPEAAEAFREAARLRPSSPEPQGNLVLALARGGRWSAATEALRRLVDLRPGQAELYVLLGALFRRTRQPHEAIRAFRWAVRHAPAPRWNRFFLGEALLGEAAWDALLDAYRTARGMQPPAEADESARPWRAPESGPRVLAAPAPRRLRARAAGRRVA